MGEMLKDKEGKDEKKGTEKYQDDGKIERSIPFGTFGKESHEGSSNDNPKEKDKKK